MNPLWASFISIFFAMDAVGILPIFTSLTQGVDPRRKRAVVVQSLATALGVGVGFLFLGQAVFGFLGISMADFMIAGGSILFSLCLIDLVQEGQNRSRNIEDIGAVPIGTPLIVGPAVLTMMLMIAQQYGQGAALASLVVNVAIVGIVFFFSDPLMAVFGRAGSRALSKVMALLLGAIGIMMVRKGILAVIATIPR